MFVRQAWWLVLGMLLGTLACNPAPPHTPATPGSGSCATTAAACEQALLGASDATLPALLDSYAKVHGGGAYQTLLAQLKAAPAGVVWLHDGSDAGSVDGVTRLDLPAPPAHISRNALLLRLGALAGRDDIVVAEQGKPTQLFPRDVLAPFTFGLPAFVGSSREHIGGDLALAKLLRESIAAASRYDYLAAAKKADALRQLLLKQGGTAYPTREPQLRVRYGLARLIGAGITFQQDDSREGSEPAKLGEMSGAYGDFFAVAAAEDSEAAEWEKRRASLTAGLDPVRAALLDARFSTGKCPIAQLPAMTRSGDLAFSYQLSIALDPQAAPGEKAAAGKLALEPWLERYEAMVDQVHKHKLGWAFASTLLNQRGEAHGLSSNGTVTYKQVSEMALAHIAALDKLSAAEPARFQTLGVVGLVYRPGAWTDERVSRALVELVQQSVQRKLAAAKTADEVWSGALSAFAAGLSYPAQMQAVQLEALKNGLAAKLKTPFGAQRGWDVAGLHGGQLLLEVLVRSDANLGDFGPRIASALESASQLPQPELARLAAASAQYITLAGNKQLDASVSNPRMFSPERTQAREALADAIDKLAPSGAAPGAERELRDLLAGFADELVAALLARYADKPEGPQCGGRSAISDKSALRDVYDRLQKKRRSMLKRPEMTRGDNLWLKRARMLALLLSDALDAVDRSSGKLTFALPAASAQRITDQALASFADPEMGTLATRLYLVARSLFDEVPADERNVVANVVRGLNAAAKVFGESGTERGGIFQALAEVGRDKRLLAEDQAVAKVLMEHARKAYSAERLDLGDMLLMMALGSTLARDEPAPPEAISLARQHARPIELALLLYTEKARAMNESEALDAAMRKAVQSSCDPPSPEAAIKVRQAGRLFLSGKRKEAVELLDQLLVDGARDGLVVPKQVYNYKQITGDKIFNAEQSLSFAGPLLKGSGSLQVGFGYQSRSDNKETLSIFIASTSSQQANEEAARLYAHTAILASVYHRLLGNHRSAEAAARRAIGVWANGVMLGPARVPVGRNTAEWVGDALATVAIAAQLASEQGSPFLAGDLWTLVLAGLGEAADDSAVKELLAEPPQLLANLPEVTAVMARAGKVLPTLSAHLACTESSGNAAAYTRVDCVKYPEALALRVAGGLTALPRLKAAAGATTSCEGWQALDDFLGAMDEKLYEPSKLVNAIRKLRQHGHSSAAATVLTRQRHPNHCSPELVSMARELAKHTELGVHERANLLSIAANCDASSASDSDLDQLDMLTQQHASPTRSFELLVFASRMAVQLDRYAPLYSISHKPDFVRRWHKLGPQMGTAALLLQHASAIGAGKPVDERASLPYYRLLCTTFPGKERMSMCNSIALMRTDGASNSPKSAAKKALEEFIKQALAQR